MKIYTKPNKITNPTRLLPRSEPIYPKNVTKHKFSFVTAAAIIIPIIALFVIVPSLLGTLATVLQPFFKAANFTVAGAVGSNSVKHEPELLKDAEGMTNILIVGIDTREKGSKLANTDTIILATYNSKSHEVSMVSFPRDLHVNYPNSPSFGKINATYALGEARKTGSGMEYLRTLIENISGQKIHYHAMIDLKGFATIIDQLGGIDVTVDTAFSGRYPTENYGWVNVNFAKGDVHLNGDMALKFARIRYASPGSEASDFARAKRQQKIIKAVIEKATKVETLQNPKTIIEILGSVAANIKVNRISMDDIAAGLIIMKEQGIPQTFSLVLDPSAGGSYGRLITTSSLEPAAGAKNWSQVTAFIKEYVHAPALVSQKPIICLYNAGRADYAKQVSAIKSRFYFTSVKDCGTFTADSSIVYNVGGQSFAGSARYLASQYAAGNFVEASDASVEAPRGKDSPISVVLK